MQATTPSHLINSASSNLDPARNHQGRKIHGFYARFLEFLVRKTEADRRVELFGSDPFK